MCMGTCISVRRISQCRTDWLTDWLTDWMSLLWHLTSVKRNRYHGQTFSDDYSQEFVICNETGINVSLTVAYHHKFRHQNKKKQLYFVCWYVRFRLTDSAPQSGASLWLLWHLTNRRWNYNARLDKWYSLYNKNYSLQFTYMLLSQYAFLYSSLVIKLQSLRCPWCSCSCLSWMRRLRL